MAQCPSIPQGSLRVSEVISALSYALDLTEGQPSGHAVRSCVIGMRIAQELGLAPAEQNELYSGLLMKDAGCSANASKMMQILGSDDVTGKRDATRIDWTRTGWDSLQYALSHVKTGAPFLARVRGLYDLAVHQKENARLLNQIRCERGSAIARRLGLSETTAEAIHNLNEHWNGLGQPQGLRGRQIPLLSRIMNLAQTIDVFYSHYGETGPARAIQMVKQRDGRWFDPEVARAFYSVAARPAFWQAIAAADRIVVELEPNEEAVLATEERLDNICLAFADVIDAKSPFTYRHSTGVAGAAVAIARTLGMNESEVALIRRAGLLHDIGKLGVSNTILDKPGKLTDDEFTAVKRHPRFTHEILRRIRGFERIAEIAASHHEKLDGSGYFRNLRAAQLPIESRLLVVADIFDALAAQRPYRDALPLETVFSIMSKDAPRAIDVDCLDAIKRSCDSAHRITEDLLNLASHVQHENQPSCLATLP